MEIRLLKDDPMVAYAMHHYSNPACTSIDEFLSDYEKPKYIKRSISRYLTSGDLNVQLMLNNMISFFNVFGPIAGIRILFVDMPKEYIPVLKAYLEFLGYIGYNTLPETGVNFEKHECDPYIEGQLKEI